MKKIVNVAEDENFRLKRSWNGIPKGTICTVLAVGSEGILLEFNYIGVVVPRNRQCWVEFRTFCEQLRPARIFRNTAVSP